MKSAIKSKTVLILKSAPSLILSGLMIMNAGCATLASSGVLQPGDTADIHFLCRLKTGEVVASSDGVPENQPKSTIFLQRKETRPLSVAALSPDGQAPDKEEKAFEEEIVDQLARVVVGMKEGEKRYAELTAQDISARNEQNYVARLSKVRIRPKEMKMTVGDYTLRSGKSPEVGQMFTYDAAFPGRVESVNDQDVVIRFYAKPGDIIETPFGPGLIREDENNYLVDIDARQGGLIRTGSMIGRITEVDDKVITIDYRNPFGGEKLFCDVAVEKVRRVEPVTKGKGE
jgi:FKBP-type peptidyl-prolyl cis-trans isomerase 2